MRHFTLKNKKDNDEAATAVFNDDGHEGCIMPLNRKERNNHRGE